mgnify:CR=1 FL=1
MEKRKGVKGCKHRIEIIPEEILKKWRVCESGPWDYFKERDLEGCHIALDECHNLIRKGQGKVWVDSWQEWLAEIRHWGCTIEFISQSPGQVSPAIMQVAGQRLELVNNETRRDPLFRVLVFDWQQLIAKLFGEYESKIWEIEYHNQGKRWVESDRRAFRLNPELYPLYDTRSKSSMQKARVRKGDGTYGYPFEEFGWWGLIKWFVLRNAARVFPRLGFAFLVFFICFGGGARYVLGAYMGYFNRSNGGEVAENQKRVEVKSVVVGDAVKLEIGRLPDSF